MDYREELQVLLDNEDLDFKTWLLNYPLIEQPNLVREFKKYMLKEAIECGDLETAKEVQLLDQLSDHLENQIIQKFAEVQEKNNQILINAQRNFAIIKDDAFESILTNADDSQLMIDIVRRMIEIEKFNNVYDEDKWKSILHLL